MAGPNQSRWIVKPPPFPKYNLFYATRPLILLTWLFQWLLVLVIWTCCVLVQLGGIVFVAIREVIRWRRDQKRIGPPPAGGQPMPPGFTPPGYHGSARPQAHYSNRR